MKTMTKSTARKMLAGVIAAALAATGIAAFMAVGPDWNTAAFCVIAEEDDRTSGTITDRQNAGGEAIFTQDPDTADTIPAESGSIVHGRQDMDAAAAVQMDDTASSAFHGPQMDTRQQIDYMRQSKT